MADSAKLEDNFENQTDGRTWAESLKERLEQLDEAAARSNRLAAQHTKRKRAAINASLREALQTFQVHEEQLNIRVATVEKREAELAAREDLLNGVERRFESQIERLSQIKLEAANVKLPKNLGSELADSIAKTVEDRVSMLLDSNATAKHQAAEKESQKQLSLVEARLQEVQDARELLQANNDQLKKDLVETREEVLLLRLETEEQARQKSTHAEQDSQSDELIELLQCELTDIQNELRNVQSELRSTSEQLDETRAKLAESQSVSNAAQCSLTVVQEELTQTHDQLVTTRGELEATRTDLDTARGAIDDIRGQLAELQSEQSSRDQSSCDWSASTELITSEAAESSRELARLQQELLESQEFVNMLQEELSAARQLSLERFSDDSSAFSQGETSTDQALIDELQAEIESLQITLMAVRANSQLTETSAETLTLACENADLKQQNADLASQLAKLQMTGNHNPPHLNLCQESMTWEERKRLILQQLEDESSDFETSAHHQSRIDITEVITVTQAELERRDREIEELQSIIEQQSNTREGVAIGAAAIAQMLDSDELLKQERERLRAIQQEWEDKLRSAEIEMSLERAKLARERTQLEERLRAQIENSIELQKSAATGEKQPDAKSTGKPTRKWLEHLGLKDR